MMVYSAPCTGGLIFMLSTSSALPAGSAACCPLSVPAPGAEALTAGRGLCPWRAFSRYGHLAVAGTLASGAINALLIQEG